MTDHFNFKAGYSDVNGLKMYYEVYGLGRPLVLIHGEGCIIHITPGNLVPLLAKTQSYTVWIIEKFLDQ